MRGCWRDQRAGPFPIVRRLVYTTMGNVRLKDCSGKNTDSPVELEER